MPTLTILDRSTLKVVWDRRVLVDSASVKLNILYSREYSREKSFGIFFLVLGLLVRVFSHEIDGHTQLLVPSDQKVFCANLLFPMVHFSLDAWFPRFTVVQAPLIPYIIILCMVHDEAQPE